LHLIHFMNSSKFFIILYSKRQIWCKHILKCRVNFVHNCKTKHKKNQKNKSCINLGVYRKNKSFLKIDTNFKSFSFYWPLLTNPLSFLFIYEMHCANSLKQGVQSFGEWIAFETTQIIYNTLMKTQYKNKQFLLLFVN
jgi:hypothetical protein